MTALAASRIDTNAFTVCLKIGGALDWSPQGREHFYNAKEDLGTVSALERVLRFGFYWNGPLNDILVLDKGDRFAALTGCLTEIYTADTVAKIYIALLELFVERNKGDFYLQDLFIPSMPQIRSVVERFAGLFSTSAFASLVEDYMSKDHHGVVTGGTQTRKRATRMPTSRTIADPHRIADALYELLELSRDGSKTQQIKFVGGADAIAIAAIGRYLIDLSTEIYESEDGSMKKVSGPGLESHGMARVLVELSEEDPQGSKASILPQSRVVYLPQMTDIIKNNKFPNPEPVAAGRCDWKNVLSTTFRESFKRLMQGYYVPFSSALGCAARVFQALAVGDENLDQQWLVACRTYSESSFGSDYISFGLDRFPELQKSLAKVEQEMYEKTRLSYGEAEMQFEDSLSKLADNCRCKVCWFKNDPIPKGHPGAAGEQTSTKEWYCLPTLAMTIIRLIRLLSSTDILNEKLYLKRAGVEWLYNHQKSRHQRRRQMAKTHNNTREEKFVFRILDYVRIDKTAPEFSSLAVVSTLFSGVQREEDLPPYTSAIVAAGICAYLLILEEPSREAGRSARIRVIPGCINLRDDRYDGIQDLGFDPFKNTQNFVKSEVRPDQCVPVKAKDMVGKCAAQNNQRMKLCLKERLDNSFVPWLQVGLSVPGTSIRGADGEFLEWLGPARAIDNLTQGTGLTYCNAPRFHQADNIEKQLKEIIPLGFPTIRPYETYKDGDMEATIFRGDTSTALITACGCWLPVFLTESNCVKCAIHTAISKSWKTFAIICTENSYKQVSTL